MIKKFFILFLLTTLSSFIIADEYDETYSMLNQIKDVNEGLIEKVNIEHYINQYLWNISQVNGFSKAIMAYPNTYYWYMWNEFNNAKGFEKLELGEILRDK